MSTTEAAHPTTDVPNSVRPMTGDEYLDSLRDGREVYIYGERVEDVTTHPAFRNSARSIAALYDAMHAPEAEGVLRVPTDTGNGGFTHPFFKTAYSADDLVAGRDAIATWQRQVYGWMGRTPDYKAAFLGTLGANADFYSPFQANAKRWYKDTQERMLYLNHAIVHPPIDRHKAADESSDVCVHVVDETDNGLIVSGAKVVATGSALTNANFVAHYGLPVRDKRFGVIFTVPMNTKGMKLFSRASYEMSAAVMGSPFDYPLSSRADENDAIMVMDNTLVLRGIQKIIRKAEENNNLSAALRGYEMLAKHLGMFVDRTEISGPDGEAIHVKEEQVKQNAQDFTNKIIQLSKKKSVKND